jgi:hypothetical protein
MAFPSIPHFLNTLSSEDNDGHWGFTFYLTYNPHAFQHLFSSFPLSRAGQGIPLKENPPPAAKESKTSLLARRFDKFVIERFQKYLDSLINVSLAESLASQVASEKVVGVEEGVNAGAELARQIWQKLDVEYVRLPSASISKARAKFRGRHGWPEEFETGLPRSHEHCGLRYRVFVVVDDEGLESLLSGLEPAKQTREEDGVVVKTVDADYDEKCEGIIFSDTTKVEGSAEGGSDSVMYHGWMRCELKALMSWWTDMKHHGWEYVFRGEEAVYKEIIDEKLGRG